MEVEIDCKTPELSTKYSSLAISNCHAKILVCNDVMEVLGGKRPTHHKLVPTVIYFKPEIQSTCDKHVLTASRTEPLSPPEIKLLILDVVWLLLDSMGQYTE